MEHYKQIHIQPLASASVQERFLLVYNGRHYEAGAPVVDLIRCLQQENTQEEAVVEYTRGGGSCLCGKKEGHVFVRSGGGRDNTADPADVCRRGEISQTDVSL